MRGGREPEPELRLEGGELDDSIEFPLVGPGGEKIDLRRTFNSHGIANLPPMSADSEGRQFRITVPVEGSRPRTVRVTPSRPGYGEIVISGPAASPAEREAVRVTIRHVLRLDEDLSEFYRRVADDPDLAWAAEEGAGRMIQSPTVFEEVVKTVCTTNCAWSATERMVGALVEHLGERAPDAPESGVAGRAFPTPQAMAEAGEEFYREVVRAGYRGRYLLDLSRSVAEEEIGLEELSRAPREELPDEEVARRLLALPGVGPYAAAHIMLMLGRYSRLILDSWTRPTYARLSGLVAVPDAVIEERFRRYGKYAGLAFWLYLTRPW
jgi:3-methyladenine DNA glycosylase/8-oxoguanine DNA glycosylase